MDELLNLAHQGFSAIFPFIILLGFLIFVHELGHFLVAKWCGVRVEVFSLGFGKKLLKYKRGDTTYCISLVPLGGYVKMFGDEAGAEIEESLKRFSFTHKKVWQRIAVVLAGPMMNFFFAILIFMIVSMIGEEVRGPTVGDVLQDSVAYRNGFRSGDQILSVNSEKTKTWEAFQELISKNANVNVSVAVQRENSSQTSVVGATPVLKLNPNLLSLDESIGEIDGLSSFSKAAFIGVTPRSQADKLGLRIGDRIASINKKEVSYFRELENLMVTQQNQPIEIEVERVDGKSSKVLKLSGNLGTFSSLAAFGVELADLYLAKVIDESPAAAAGLRAGDKVVSIAGNKLQKWEDVVGAVKTYSGEGVVSVVVTREGEEKTFELTPKMTANMTHQGTEDRRYTIGIVPWVQNAPPQMITLASNSIGSAFSRGIKRTMDVTVMTVVSFLRLIQAKISPKNIGGVVAIGQAASETFKIGIGHFLQLMGVISVNLFILNLLPIPVLDGGHLLFYSIEALKGTPLSMRKMEIAQQVGLVMLMSLMALSLFNDFSRVFGF